MSAVNFPSLAQSHVPHSADQSSPTLEVEVIHRVPGRIRLRIPDLEGDGYANHLQQSLNRLRGVKEIRFNLAARCLVIDYEADLLGEPLFHQLFPDLATGSAQTEPLLRPPVTPAVDEYRLPLNLPLLLERLSLPCLSLAIALLMPVDPLLNLVVVGFVLVAVWPTFEEAWHNLQHKHLSVSIMESLWTILHTLEGQYVAPVLAATMAGGGGALRDMTARAGERQQQLLTNTRLYWIEREGKELQLPLLELLPGDRINVVTGAAIPVDGRVLKGTALLDQHSLTGESDLVPCIEGQQVYASTLIAKGQLLILAEQTAYDTRAGRAVNLLNTAPSHDTRIENYAEEVGNQAILPSMALGAVIYGFTLDSHRALAALQLDFGAGIGISVPTAILSALTSAARNGVFIRSGRALEILAEIDTVVFDKTGTLTQARGEVVGIETLSPDISTQEILSLAASVERYLTHPLSEAIVSYAQTQGVELWECETWDFEIGMGITAQIKGQEILVGNNRFLQVAGVNPDLSYIRSKEGVIRNRSIIYVARDRQLIGVIFYSNALRPEAATVIRNLADQGIESHMLTGDNHRVASAVAYKLGLSMGHIYTEALPERKAEVLQKMHQEGLKIAYVGDGINDSAALAYADVSISLGGGSDIARYTADVVLMDDDLRGLLYAIQLARETIEIIQQNIALVVVPNVSAVLGGIFFGLHPVLAVGLSNGATLLAELNGLRPLFQSDRQDPPLDPDTGRSEEGLLDIPWQKRPRNFLQDLQID